MAQRQTSTNVDALAALAERLSYREDGFSRQLSLTDDPLFWWRAEFGLGDSYRITDFNAGAQADDMMIVCLRHLLEAEETQGLLRVEFYDITPQDLEPVQHRIEVTNRVAQIEKWIAGAALSMSARFSDPQLSTHRGKIILTTEMELAT